MLPIICVIILHEILLSHKVICKAKENMYIIYAFFFFPHAIYLNTYTEPMNGILFDEWNKSCLTQAVRKKN